MGYDTEDEKEPFHSRGLLYQMNTSRLADQRPQNRAHDFPSNDSLYPLNRRAGCL